MPPSSPSRNRRIKNKTKQKIIPRTQPRGRSANASSAEPLLPTCEPRRKSAVIFFFLFWEGGDGWGAEDALCMKGHLWGGRSGRTKRRRGASGEEEMWLLCAEDGVIQPHCASQDCSLKACSVNRDPSEIFDLASFC